MLERRVIEVEGIVQGVGFRPYVHRLATGKALHGFVRNDRGSVRIEVEGLPSEVAAFCRELPVAPPALATIARMTILSAPVSAPAHHECDFRIAGSESSATRRDAASTPPDAATCDACLAELFDASNRRFGHAFITCTQCGPRHTIVHHAPYDRERTSMSGFTMCATCKAEYGNPADRRFHAEAIACHDCGPRLTARALPPLGAIADGSWALELVADAMRAGQVAAIKALGGYHLACDATNELAVARLRERKRRPAKPFAVMVRDLAMAEAIGTLTDDERDALVSPARPVVLVPHRAGGGSLAPGVAPGSGLVGLMLPSTPVHHLLLASLGRPLVMTSGNRASEPTLIDDAVAMTDLATIADVLLSNDRPIVARCDDSVVRRVAGAVRSVRRARGYVPQAITMPLSASHAVLAVGGHQKNTVCVASSGSARLCAHVGDLDSLTAREACSRAIDALLLDAGRVPDAIAHDLHPEYASTRIAESVATARGIALVSVQHHHAHVAACLAEHGVAERAIGVVFDGAGLGSDGATWGGEFLAVDGPRFARCGHLAYVPLPGGDASARTPWRSAAAHLAAAGVTNHAMAVRRRAGIGDAEWSLVRQLLAHADGQPRTSSIGRLFDAVASLLGVCDVATHEGQAAMAVEAAAGSVRAPGYPITLSEGTPWTADPAPIIRGVLGDLAARRYVSEVAAAFHSTLSDLVVLGCERIREEVGLETVVLSGGVFMNARLAGQAHDALVARRFRVLMPRQVPCNDGGLALGQAYVATCALQESPCA